MIPLNNLNTSTSIIDYRRSELVYFFSLLCSGSREHPRGSYALCYISKPSYHSTTLRELTVVFQSFQGQNVTPDATEGLPCLLVA